MSMFYVLVTRTQKTPADDQLRRFRSWGDDNDSFMKREVICEAGKMEETARRCMQFVSSLPPSKADECARWLAAGDFWRVVQEIHGGELDEAGNLYELRNPDGQWDGWAGNPEPEFFKLKRTAPDAPDPGRASVARMGDIDWEGMRAENEREAREQWTEAQAQPGLRRKHGIWPEDTLEAYVARQSAPMTFALLHDDQWRDWETECRPDDADAVAAWRARYQATLDSLDDDDEVAIVRCHC